MPALILLLLFALGAVDVVTARMQCLDAALSTARGGDGAAAARARAPHGATVSISRDGDRVRAEVWVTVRPLGPHLPGFTVSGDAVADAEPTDATGSGAG